VQFQFDNIVVAPEPSGTLAIIIGGILTSFVRFRRDGSKASQIN
jgi:hypothetical protein